jgi:hypothetical protein|tara:strand:+ start:7852 stop:8040 length:189 start_codon:yes stop_codon:yes gene_type:complete
LPTEVLRDGSTIDVKIANFALQYENYLSNSHTGNSGDNLTEDQMQEMLNTARAHKNDKEVDE